MVFRLYLRRLFLRLAIVSGLVFLYFFRREALLAPFQLRLFSPLSAQHLIWGLLMANMLVHLWPHSPLAQAGRKRFAKNCLPPQDPAQKKALADYRGRMNRGAAGVMLLWLTANALVALAFWRGIIGRPELVLVWAAYFLGDLVCMTLFCPFQRWLMKNRCCNNCRIFDWGHFMMYTPFALIDSFFSRSLFFTACLLLALWELAWLRHPERFFDETNPDLKCANCRDRLCLIKRPLV